MLAQPTTVAAPSPRNLSGVPAWATPWRANFHAAAQPGDIEAHWPAQTALRVRQTYRSAQGSRPERHSKLSPRAARGCAHGVVPARLAAIHHARTRIKCEGCRGYRCSGTEHRQPGAGQHQNSQCRVDPRHRICQRHRRGCQRGPSIPCATIWTATYNSVTDPMAKARAREWCVRAAPPRHWRKARSPCP